MQPGVSLAKYSPFSLVRHGQPGESRRQGGVWQLQWIAGDDPHPGHAGREHRGKGDDVVLDDDIRLHFREDFSQALFDIDRARGQLLPDGEDQ